MFVICIDGVKMGKTIVNDSKYCAVLPNKKDANKTAAVGKVNSNVCNQEKKNLWICYAEYEFLIKCNN